MVAVGVAGLLQSLKATPPCHPFTSLWMPMQDAAGLIHEGMMKIESSHHFLVLLAATIRDGAQ